MDTLISPTEQPGAVSLLGATCIPGPIVLFGSGEAAPSARRVHAAALDGVDPAAELEPEPPPAALAELVTAREAARNQGDWALADKLRAEIVCAGWQVQDTHAGPLLVPA